MHMNNTAVVMEVSRKTGIAPELCEQVVRALEETLRKEFGGRPGTGVLNRIAGAVYRMTEKNGNQS